MNYSVLGTHGHMEGKVNASTLEEACRSWAEKCWDPALVEGAVAQAKLLPLDRSGQLGAHLDAYVLCPAGAENECLAQYRELFHSDPHYAQESQLPEEPVRVDTGGAG